MLTVAELLEDPALGLRPVVPADVEAAVRWVAVSELPDPAPFLEGGEVLLTTGLNTAEWDQEWDGYVRRLVGARTSALGLAAGLTHDRAPEALADACRRHGMNLFEVPPRTAFVAVSRTVAQRLEEQSAAAARQALTMQRELTQAALRRNDDSAVPRRLGEVLGGAVGTMDAEGRWETAPRGADAERLPQPVVAAEVRRLRPQGLRASSVVTGADGTTVVQPLGLRGKPSLYLAVWTAGRLTDAHRSAVTTAAALTGLALESRNDQRRTDRRLRRRAVELLVAGEPRTAAIVLAAATGVGPTEVRFPTRLQALLAAGSPDQLADGLSRVEGLAAGGHLPLAAHVGPSEEQQELWAVGTPQHVDRLVPDLVGLGLQVGVGSAVGRSELGRSRAAAGHALSRTSPRAPVARWEQIVDQGVLALVGQTAGDSFAESFLAPLDRYGERRDELVETLRAFLQHQGRIGPLAEALGVHRNTVRNRIRDIESALGGSLEDPSLRVNSWVALELDATRRLRAVSGAAAGYGTAPGPPSGGSTSQGPARGSGRG